MNARAMNFVFRGHIVPYTRTTQRSKWNERYKRYQASKEAIQVQAANEMVLENLKRIPKGQPFVMSCRFFLTERLYSADLDNLVKAVADALNGVAYHDDRYLISLTATKKQADFEYTHVKVRAKR